MFQSQPSDYYLVMQNLPDLIALIEEVESFSVSCRKVIAGYQNDLPYYSGMLDRVSIRDGKKSLSAIKKNVTVSVEDVYKRQVYVPRDTEIENKMLAAEMEFWYFVENKKAPAVNSYFNRLCTEIKADALERRQHTGFL